MNKVTGGGLPARLWKNLMVSAHNGRTVKSLPAAGTLPKIEKFEPSKDKGTWQIIKNIFGGD